MKKILFAVMAMVAVSFASCSQKSAYAEKENVDSVAVDSVVVDSVAVMADSVVVEVADSVVAE